MADAPPPYSASGAPSTSNGYAKQPSAAGLSSHLPSTNIPQQPSPNTASPPLPVFPQQFGIYHASGSNTDMRISLSQESPTMFYISTHGAFSSQPSVILHCGPHERTSPMATAELHSFSGTVDIMLLNQRLKLEREAPFSSVNSFVYPVPQSDGQTLRERFEWKSSSGPEVQSLQGSSRGMKCVRVRSGEVVAAWARPNSGHAKKGKMRFLLNEGGMGDDRGRFEIAVVISMLSIMEKARRSNKNSRGATAGGFGGGGAGGGGC
ncbi:hypothetical protein D0Z07_0731 [Hyphodiscus hymeniophilus]|uniref:Uncharacterized protein n=1 Tax=Hyphodiscus hymeniophilus TaxID=353542 RepID=A0A9P7B115_9HELO|nr:hypothetical protein D0Z07_0731 [Hyphodiscus hymeniophilus]